MFTILNQCNRNVWATPFPNWDLSFMPFYNNTRERAQCSVFQFHGHLVTISASVKGKGKKKHLAVIPSHILQSNRLQEITQRQRSLLQRSYHTLSPSFTSIHTFTHNKVQWKVWLLRGLVLKVKCCMLWSQTKWPNPVNIAIFMNLAVLKQYRVLSSLSFTISSKPVMKFRSIKVWCSFFITVFRAPLIYMIFFFFWSTGVFLLQCKTNPKWKWNA